MLAADYVLWLNIALMVAISLYYRSRINVDRVAMQWGLDGKPTWYAPKSAALWGAPAFTLGVRGLIWLAMTYMPTKVQHVEIGLLLLSIIVVAAHYWILRSAART
jgi:hypothetical protein